MGCGIFAMEVCDEMWNFCDGQILGWQWFCDGWFGMEFEMTLAMVVWDGGWDGGKSFGMVFWDDNKTVCDDHRG